MKRLMDQDAAFARKAIASGKATPEEVAFLDTMIGMEAAREPVSDDEYRRLQELTGGYFSPSGSIFDRADPGSYENEE